MNKEEILKKFEQNVQFIRRNVPPDDIYIFTEQTLMAAFYFFYKWSECTNLEQEMKDNEISRKWIKNILTFKDFQDKDLDIDLDLDMKSIEEE